MLRVWTVMAFALLLMGTTSAQEINVRANLGTNSITDFDKGFVGAGIGLEGAVSRHWSLGADLNWAGNEHHDLFHFNPSVRYYFNQSLQGFFLGLGAGVYEIRNSQGGPVGFPIDVARGSKALVGGPEMSLGIQTRIANRFTMGVRGGFTYFTDYDLDENAGINLNFTVGVLLF